MRFKMQAMDKEGTEQSITIEAQSSQDAFQKIREQGLFPTKVVEIVEDAGMVTDGLPLTESRKKITVSPLQQVLAVAAAAGDRIIEAKAETLAEARAVAYKQIPDNAFPVSEAIISKGADDAKELIVTAQAIGTAWKEAEAKLPENVNVITRKVITEPATTTTTVTANSEVEARSEAKKKITADQEIRAVKLIDRGKKGILGIGKRSATYEVTLFQTAKVSLCYAQPAQIQLTIGSTDEVTLNKEYTNQKHAFSLRYPEGWEVVFQDGYEGGWVKPVGFGGPRGDGGRPGFTVQVSGLSTKGDLRSYMLNAQSDLSRMFGGINLLCAEERSIKKFPTAWMRYKYQARVGSMEELNVTLVLGTQWFVLLQFICECPASAFPQLHPTFCAMINSVTFRNDKLRLAHVILTDVERCSKCNHPFQASEGKSAFFDFAARDLAILCENCRDT